MDAEVRHAVAVAKEWRELAEKVKKARKIPYEELDPVRKNATIFIGLLMQGFVAGYIFSISNYSSYLILAVFASTIFFVVMLMIFPRFGLGLLTWFSFLSVIGLFLAPPRLEFLPPDEPEPDHKHIRGADVVSANELAKIIRSRDQS